MATAAKPTFVLAPGAWHKASCYSLVEEILASKGFPVELADHPSVGAEPPTKSLRDDAAALRAVLERLAGEEKEIVLVVHSYGGFVGANAVKGLGYKQRAKEGKKGGVVTFVYLCAFAVPLGKSLKDMLGGQFPPWIKFDGNYVTPQTPEEIFYHDVDPALQKKAIEKLHHHSAPAFTDAVENEPWHDIDCMYFFCREDKAIPIFVQESMAALLGPLGFTYSLDTSHSPFLCVPDKVVEGLEYAAKVGQERVRA